MPPLVLFQTQRFLSSVNTASPAASSSPMCRQSMQTKAIAPSWRRRCIGERLLQKVGELLAAHLAGGQGEVAVLNGAEPADMAVDRHVVGRIGEDQVAALSGHETGVTSSDDPRRRTAAGDDPGARDRLGGSRPSPEARDEVFRAGWRLGRSLPRLVEDEIDFGQREAGEFQVEVEVDKRL